MPMNHIRTIWLGNEAVEWAELAKAADNNAADIIRGPPAGGAANELGELVRRYQQGSGDAATLAN
jgi:hypothetical protein